MNEAEAFQRLCQECRLSPGDAALLAHFDQLHGPKIEEWTQICFPRVSDELRSALYRFIRRWVIEEGAKGGRTAGQAVSLVALELYRAMRDLGWSPG